MLAAHQNHLGTFNKTCSHLQGFRLSWWLMLTSARTENHWIEYYIFLSEHFWMQGQRPPEAPFRSGAS